MPPTPYIKELLSIAIHLAEHLTERIPKSESLQHNCKQTATKLRAWRKTIPDDMEFLLKPTGDKTLYGNTLSPLAELLCILCMSVPRSQLTTFLPSLAQPLKQRKNLLQANSPGRPMS